MKHHHRHYLVWIQLSALAGLFLVGVGGQGFARLQTVLPFVFSIGMMAATIWFSLAIVKMMHPHLAIRDDGHMHGSMLPVLVFEPQY